MATMATRRTPQDTRRDALEALERLRRRIDARGLLERMVDGEDPDVLTVRSYLERAGNGNRG